MNDSHLFGQQDHDHSWKDGIIPRRLRQFAKDSQVCKSTSLNPDYFPTFFQRTVKWLVLDGPVDPCWVENLNSVLDENKSLSLDSGEIVQLQSNFSIMFETVDMSLASPATISRCGVVYLGSPQLQYSCLVQKWIQVCALRNGRTNAMYFSSGSQPFHF